MSTPSTRWWRAFDDIVDSAVAPLRGNRAADTAAAVISNLSDHGVIWILAAAVTGRRVERRRRAVVALAVSGMASLTVNAVLKAAVGRRRPDEVAGVPRRPPRPAVRRPTSSSFPSGHTLAAFTSAVVLADGPAARAAYLAVAAGVGASRVQLADHHATDVAAGALIGTLLGLAARPLVERLAGRRPGRRARRRPAGGMEAHGAGLATTWTTRR
ncbi:MAG TPA: phosphatase PAP2 family protein [Acidimicrobiales bacterium]|nr:phosphatase PAP2 family protein [Acidimicrobiales bacterium]